MAVIVSSSLFCVLLFFDFCSLSFVFEFESYEKQEVIVRDRGSLVK